MTDLIEESEFYILSCGLKFKFFLSCLFLFTVVWNPHLGSINYCVSLFGNESWLNTRTAVCSQHV